MVATKTNGIKSNNKDEIDVENGGTRTPREWTWMMLNGLKESKKIWNHFWKQWRPGDLGIHFLWTNYQTEGWTKTIYGFIVVAIVCCWLMGYGDGVILFIRSEIYFVHSFALDLSGHVSIYLVQFSNWKVFICWKIFFVPFFSVYRTLDERFTLHWTLIS